MKNKLLIFLCIFNLQFFGQAILGVDTILKTGPVDKRINVVIISEGFTAAQMSVFNAKAISCTRVSGADELMDITA